jgi:hypothetical protein
VSLRQWGLAASDLRIVPHVGSGADATARANQYSAPGMQPSAAIMSA